MTAISIGGWLARATKTLAHTDSARLDAELLLGHVLQLTRTRIYTRMEKQLDAAELAELDALLQRRRAREPLAYIVGQREFWSLQFDVSPDVLVPRADTELLVELGLAAAAASPAGALLDAGTGSGAVALALAHELRQPGAAARASRSVIASDISSAALALARHNARRLRLEHVHFVQAEWLHAFADNSLAVIISNPPYLADNDPHLQQGELCFEPQQALVSGKDGLDALTALLDQAPRAAVAGAAVLLEHGYQQGAAVRSLMQDRGYEHISSHRDLAGHERVTSARLRD